MNLLIVILANLIAIAPLVLCPEHEKKNVAPAAAPNARLVRAAAAADRYPDTVAGKRARAFIEAFNSDDGKIRALSTALRPSPWQRITQTNIRRPEIPGRNYRRHRYEPSIRLLAAHLDAAPAHRERGLSARSPRPANARGLHGHTETP